MATKTGTPPHGNGGALLTAGFASIGKDRGDREGQRLSQESVENFIRRASRCIAQRCSLSQREEEILRYLARGYSYTYTAQDFCISENAVAAPNGSCVSPRRAPGHRARPYAQPGFHPASWGRA